MKHQEFNEKKFAQGVSSISEEAMAMSNQVSDMMREKCPANYNFNINVFNNSKEEMLASEGAGKAKLMNSKQMEDAAITFKKDDDGLLFKKDEYGNLIKVQRDGGQKSQFNTADIEIPLLYGNPTKFKL